MLQIIIQGLLLSGLYALIAVGFTLIFSVGRVLNLAYGAYLMLGGYAFFYVSQTLGMPKLLGVVAAVAVGVIAGLMKHRFIVKPLKGDMVPVEIATLILAVVLQSAVVLMFGDSSKILHSIIPGVVQVGTVSVPYSNVFAMIVSWTVLIALYLFIRKTHLGRAMQAVSMDQKGAAISGVNPDHVNMMVWGISGGLGALGGRLLRLLHPALSRHVGRPADHRGRRRHRWRHRVNHRHPDRSAHHRVHGGDDDFLDRTRASRRLYHGADHHCAGRQPQRPFRAGGNPLTSNLNLRHAIYWALFAGLLFAMPYLVSKGDLRTMIFALYVGIFAMSWDFLSGRTGLHQLRPPVPDRDWGICDCDPQLPLRRAGDVLNPACRHHHDGRLYHVHPAGASHQRQLFRAGDAGVHGADVSACAGHPPPT